MRLGMLVSHLPEFRVGGAEVQALCLARELSSRHTVTVLARSTRRTFRARRIESGALALVERPNVGVPVGRLLADALITLRILGSTRPRPDLVLAYQTGAEGWIAALARRLLGLPFVVFIMGGRDYMLSASARARLLTPWILRRASGVFVQSPAIRRVLLEELAGAGHTRLAVEVEHKMSIVRNGVALEAAPPGPPGDKLLYVGRLIRIKGVAHLIEAVRRLGSEELLIVGDGKEAEALRRQARGLKITFVGRVPPQEVQRYYRQAKILVLPSVTQEGFPNTIMEAMAHGVPVVASRVGGVPDLVEHGRTGLLTAPGDVEDLARAIGRVARDPGLLRTLSLNCLEAIQNYGWARVAPDAEAALEAVIRGRAERGAA